MIPSDYFVTGTDTEVGKTYFSEMLIRELVASGKRVVGMKPVASGCQITDDGLRNEDALRLMSASNVEKLYQHVNPYAFEPAIAPHLAAKMTNSTIEIDEIMNAYLACKADADIVVVEGVGGWLVPLNERHSVADLAMMMQLPVILVVGIRLGCINHALLTACSIEEKGLQLHGWVANRIDPSCEMIEENIIELKKRISAPMLSDLEWSGFNEERDNQYC